MSKKKLLQRRLRTVALVGIESLEHRRMFSTYTVNGAGGADYTDLETAITSVPAGSTLLVSAGTYTAHTTTQNPFSSVFWINKALTLKSVSGAASTILKVPGTQPQDLSISVSNVYVDGFTLQGGEFCANVESQNPGALSNVVLKNLKLTPDSTDGNGHGILFESVSNSVIDNCQVGTSYANGIFLDAGSDNDTVINNTVAGTITQHALAIKDSNNDTLSNNTVNSSAADGLILVNASNNTITANYMTNFQVDGICLSATCDDNYVALNVVASTGLAQGRTVGTGIWMNDSSNSNTIYANTVSGSAECGIDIFVSSNNLVDGNDIFGNYEGGVFVFDCVGYPLSTGPVPANTVIVGNWIHNNTTDAGITLRGTNNTDVERNFISGAYTGVTGSSNEIGFSTERASGTTFVNNDLENLSGGIYAYATTTNLSVYRNRFFNIGENYAFSGATIQFDDSVTIGGNYWSNYSVAGNPSSGKPYTNFIYTVSGQAGGGFADNYPFQDQSFGEAPSVTVTSPIAGTMVSANSKRAITWDSTGSTLVDIYYSSSETGQVLIAQNQPNTGVLPWEVPNLPQGTDYTIQIAPVDSTGQILGAASVGPTFSTEGNGNLTLLTPTTDAAYASSSSVQVAWYSAVPNTPVDVQLQTNGGSWTTYASSVTDDFATITLPSFSTIDARIRIVNHATGLGDTQDGTFRIGTTAGVSSVPTLLIGSTQTITWSSPTNSTMVNVQYWNGVTWNSLATDLPDDGHLSFFVPEMFTNGATIRIQYLNDSGTQVGTATSNSFNIEYTLATGSTVAMYRLYSNGTKEHLYTTSLTEYNALGAGGWSQEGSPNKVYNAPAVVGGVNTEPDYRLYSPTTYQHLWTTDRNEYFTLRASGAWQPEGVADYEFATAVTGSIPRYRLSYNGPTLLHLWTTDQNEYDTLPTAGWVQEFIAGYVVAN